MYTKKAMITAFNLAFIATTAEQIHCLKAQSAGRKTGLALSGGGMRAIAFHLGCLRALHDLRLLDCIDVVSSVSGGSIISAMYAYSNEPFLEFDKRVFNLLRQGLQKRIVREVFTIWYKENYF